MKLIPVKIRVEYNNEKGYYQEAHLNMPEEEADALLKQALAYARKEEDETWQKWQS